ncbi:MAG TPA: heavy metal-associated domain-containing protein, partial [Pyrinomonadaceae bacterium]|nr:heavy metal-associated domain-containing protein [Pyrinomonadaceae bacterium]
MSTEVTDERPPAATDVSPEPAPAASGGRVDLPITGMTCAACARRIERRLSKVPGVRSAGVNFATARATVEYEPRETGVEEFVKTVEDIGYGVLTAGGRGEPAEDLEDL